MVLAYQTSDGATKTGLSRAFYMIEKYLLKAFDCDRCSILLIEKDKIRILSASGSSETLGETQLENSSEDLKHLATIRWGTLSGIVKERVTRYFNPDGVSQYSLIMAPIFLGDYLRGVVYLARSASKAFNEEDQKYLDLFASKLTLLILKTLKHS